MTETIPDPGSSPDDSPVTVEVPDTIDEALARIDLELSRVGHRDLVSADEVADLLLDVRRILRAAEADAVPAEAASAH